MEKITVKQISYHRNGISGEGFHAVLFESEYGLMVATVFDGRGQCAVLQVPMLSDPEIGVRFGQNSWRGDHFEYQLREAIEKGESDGSIRVGPFAIPVAPLEKPKAKRKTKAVRNK